MVFQSQGSNTPSSIIQALIMSQPNTQPLSPSYQNPPPQPPPQRAGPAGRPRFTPLDESAPSRGELIAYYNQMETYHQTIMGILQFMNINPNTWPPDIDFTVEAAVRNAGTVYRMVADMERTISDWEKCLNDHRVLQA